MKSYRWSFSRNAGHDFHVHLDVERWGFGVCFYADVQSGRVAEFVIGPFAVDFYWRRS